MADCVCCGQTHCFYESAAKANRRQAEMDVPAAVMLKPVIMLEPVKIKLLGPAEREPALLIER